MSWPIFVGMALLSSATVAGICYLVAPYLRSWLLRAVVGPILAGVCAGLVLAMAAPGSPVQYAIESSITWSSHLVAVVAGCLLGRDRLARPKQGGLKRSSDSRHEGLWDQQLDGCAPDPSARLRE